MHRGSAALLAGIAAAAADVYFDAGVPSYPLRDHVGCSMLVFANVANRCDCSTIIEGAVVRIIEGYHHGSDVLWCDGCLSRLMREDFDHDLGILRLYGKRTIQEYSEALASVQFRSATHTGLRFAKKLVFNYGAAMYSPYTQKYYILRGDYALPCAMRHGGCRWEAAQRECADPGHDFLGMVGYLFAPKDRETLELDIFTYNGASDPLAWVGCHDALDEGKFTWVTGASGCEPYTTALGTVTDTSVFSRSACRTQLPFLDSSSPLTPRDCKSPWQCSGREVQSHLFAAWQPDDGRMGGGGPHGEDFCRHDVVTDLLADVALDPMSGVALYYCEYGDVGAACIASGMAGEVTMAYTPLGEDECFPPQKAQTFTELDVKVPLFPGLLCSDIGTVDCPCTETVDIDSFRVTMYNSAPADKLVLNKQQQQKHLSALSFVGCLEVSDACIPAVNLVVETPGMVLREIIDAVAGTVAEIDKSDLHKRRHAVWNLGPGTYLFTTRTYVWFRVGDPSSWEDAAAACSASRYLWLPGYLATFDSSVEINMALWDEVFFMPDDSPWVGLAKRDSDFRWVWASGPEGCRPYDPQQGSVYTSTHCDLSSKRVQGARGTAADPRMGLPTSGDFGYIATRLSDQALHISGKGASAAARAFLCEFSPSLGALCVKAVHGEVYVENARHGGGSAVGGPCGDAWVQECESTDFLTHGSFVCTCKEPYVPGGAPQFGEPAECYLGECSATCPTCRPPWLQCGQQQICEDENMLVDSLNDWFCKCPSPYYSAVSGKYASTCMVDECDLDDRCSAWGQVCIDTTHEVLETWLCACPSPTQGPPRQGFRADCTLDECSAVCPTCVPPEGCGANQVCVDMSDIVNLTGQGLSDWYCVCVPPLEGAGAQKNATCARDECLASSEDAARAATIQQECPGFLSGWERDHCLAMPFRCAYVDGACIVAPDLPSGVCIDARAICTDPSPASPLDYVCDCPPTYLGSTVGGAAVCRPDECEPGCSSCIGVGGCGPQQVCVDGGQIGDWECRCVFPAVGDPRTGASAVCRIDECDMMPCGPLAIGAIGSASLACWDPNQDVNAIGDYECTCESPYSTVPAGLSVRCEIDECSGACFTCAGTTCSGADQLCDDPSFSDTALGDWLCLCPVGTFGDPVKAGRASCAALPPPSPAPPRVSGAPSPTTPRPPGSTQAPSSSLPSGPTPSPGFSTARPDASDASGGALVDPSAWMTMTAGAASTTESTGATDAPVLANNRALTGAGSAVAGVGVLRSTSATAMWLLVVGGECRARRDVDDYPLLLHPTRMVLDGSVAAGVVAGNLCISVATWMIFHAVFQTVSTVGGWRPRLVMDLDAQGCSRFPSLPIQVFVFLYQGTTLAAAELVLRPSSLFEVFIGVWAILLCVVAPAFLAHVVVRDVPSRAFYTEDATTGSVMRWLLIGRGEWVSRYRKRNWIQRWSCVVRPYGPHATWYLFLELLASLTVSVVTAIETDGFEACGHVKTASAVVIGLMCAVEAAVRPRAVARSTVFMAIALAVQCAGTALMAAGFYSGERGSRYFAYAEYMLFAALWCLLVNTVLDLAGLFVVTSRGRRTQLQERSFVQTDRTAGPGEDPAPLTRGSSCEPHETLYDNEHLQTLNSSCPFRAAPRGLADDVADTAGLVSLEREDSSELPPRPPRKTRERAVRCPSKDSDFGSPRTAARTSSRGGTTPDPLSSKQRLLLASSSGLGEFPTDQESTPLCPVVATPSFGPSSSGRFPLRARQPSAPERHRADRTPSPNPMASPDATPLALSGPSALRMKTAARAPSGVGLPNRCTTSLLTRHGERPQLNLSRGASARQADSEALLLRPNAAGRPRPGSQLLVAQTSSSRGLLASLREC